MAEEKKIILDISAPGSGKTIADLRKEVSSLKDALLLLDKESKEYADVMRAIGEVSAKVAQVNNDAAIAAKNYQNEINGINQSAEQQQETISSLRQTINGYRDDLVNLDSDSQEYRETVQKIEESQRRLNKVLTDAQGSTIKGLKSEINTLKDDLVGLDQTSQQYGDTLVKIGELQNKINDITRDSQAATYNYVQQLSNFANIGASISGAFSAAQGVVALFGSESESLQKIMVRLQASIALVNGLKGLAGLQNSLPILTTSFRTLQLSINTTITGLSGLQKAIIATGIGAFVVAIGVLIANFDRLREAINGTSSDSASLRDSLISYNSAIEENTSLANLRIRVAQAEGKTEEEIIAIRRREIDNIIELTQAQINRYQSTSKLTKKEREDLKKLTEDYERYLAQRLQTTEDSAVLVAKRGKEAADAQKKAQDDAIKKAQEASDKAKKIREKEAQDIAKITKGINDSLLLEYDRQVQDLTNTLNEQLELFNRHGLDVTDLVEKYNRDLSKLATEENQRLADEFIIQQQAQITSLRNANEQKSAEFEIYIAGLEQQIKEAQFDELNGDTSATERIQAIQEQIATAQAEQQEVNDSFYDEYTSILRGILDNEILSAEQRVNVEIEAQNAINQQMLAGVTYRSGLVDQEIAKKKAQQEAEDKVNKLREKNNEDLLNSVSAAASASASLLGESTVAGKALGVASATVDTYVAANKALSLGPIAGPIAAAATILSGLANVKSILSVKVPGKTTDTASVSTSAASTPNIQSYYTPEITEETTALTASDTSIYNKRVYVTDRDISDTVNMNKVRVKEATF